jgi:hypothetical protein
MQSYRIYVTVAGRNMRPLFCWALFNIEEEVEMEGQMLVSGIKLAVITCNIFIEKYPVLTGVLNKSKHPHDDWVFFMTIAGVGIYLLTHKVSDKEYNEIVIQLSGIDKQMPEALNNLFGFIKHPKDLRVEIGFWVLWNIAGEPPTHEESMELAPAIGTYLTRVVKDLTD